MAVVVAGHVLLVTLLPPAMAEGWSAVAGVALRSEGGRLTCLYRSYGAGSQNPHAGAFGSHMDASNERGFYLGWSAGPAGPP